MIVSQTLERLNQIRIELDLSYPDVAEKGNLPVATVKRVLSKQTENPTFETIAAIARALNCPLDDIILGTVSPTNQTGSSVEGSESNLTRELLDAIHETADQGKRLDDFRAACEQRIHDRDRLLATRDKWIRHLSIFAVAETAAVILVWIIDFLMPNVGWIRQLVQSLSSSV